MVRNIGLQELAGGMAGDAIQDGLDRFRAAVLGDAALQTELHAIDDPEAFAVRAVALAAARGLRITAEELAPALRPEPLGLSRWSGAAPSRAVPQIGWLPVNVLQVQGQLCIDWAYFGSRRLTAPFYEDSVRQALRLPLNCLARHRTLLTDLPAAIAQTPSLRPNGFIFHMSRCGSTLTTQMLATDARNLVVSEAAPIDFVLRLNPGTGSQALEMHAALLTAMVGALGQRRSAEQARYFIKLDSWHTLALPLFRRAFPDVPWIFLYREPAAVLASQMRERGIQMVPEFLPPALFGLSDADTIDSAAYCAQVLGRTCEAMVEPCARAEGRLVNYRDLPQALWDSILPHFAIAATAQDRERMAAAAQFDAKMPRMTFSSAGDAARAMADGALSAIAERQIGPVYARLETLRRRRQ